MSMHISLSQTTSVEPEMKHGKDSEYPNGDGTVDGVLRLSLPVSLRRLRIVRWVLVPCFGARLLPPFTSLWRHCRRKESLFWQVLYIGATGLPSHDHLPNIAAAD